MQILVIFSPFSNLSLAILTQGCRKLHPGSRVARISQYCTSTEYSLRTSTTGETPMFGPASPVLIVCPACPVSCRLDDLTGPDCRVGAGPHRCVHCTSFSSSLTSRWTAVFESSLILCLSPVFRLGRVVQILVQQSRHRHEPTANRVSPHVKCRVQSE